MSLELIHTHKGNQVLYNSETNRCELKILNKSASLHRCEFIVNCFNEFLRAGYPIESFSFRIKDDGKLNCKIETSRIEDLECDYTLYEDGLFYVRSDKGFDTLSIPKELNDQIEELINEHRENRVKSS